MSKKPVSFTEPPEGYNDWLAGDLRAAFPEMKGFSRTNLLYMRAFAAAWPDTETVHQLGGQMAAGAIVQQAGGQFEPGAILHQLDAQIERGGILQAPLAQLPWRHHCVLLDKFKMAEERLWYAAKAIENNWSRNTLNSVVIW